MRCPIYTCQLVREKSVQYQTGRMTSTAEARRIALELTRDILENSPAEQFLVITCDTRLKPIGIHVITVGTLDSSLVHAREVFRPAFLTNASSIFLVHNHPSGDLTPSQADHTVTRDMKEAGEIIGIAVRDHLIVGWSDGDWQAVSIEECR